jgi:hypothetical protein
MTVAGDGRCVDEELLFWCSFGFGILRIFGTGWFPEPL